MQFQEQNRYAYPVDVVLKVFSDKDYFIEKYARAGARNIQVQDHQYTGDRSRVTVSRDVAVDVNVPAFARRHVPDTITIVQTDQWDHEARTGQLEISFKGMPARVSCIMMLEADGDHTHLSLNFSVRVDVPFVGQKLARLLASDLQEKFLKDSAAAQAAMDQVAPQYHQIGQAASSRA